MKFDDAVKLIETIAPIGSDIEFDNSGVQVKVGRGEIKRILVCLEINMDVIEEAIRRKADMILTHHPLIFNPLKSVTGDDFPGKYIQETIKHDISVYSAHLSFDFASKGNNFYLARLLDLFVKEEGSMKDGYYGMLPEPMTMEEACRHVEASLDLPENYIRCVDGGKDKLVTVGYCTGAGGDYIYSAVARGCDLFITGDLKLHEAQYARAKGMSVIDAGHYGTEKIFTENMSHQIYTRAAEMELDVDVLMADAGTNPYTI